MIATRTGTQIRSHAQKFFSRIKNELGIDDPLAYAKANSCDELQLYKFDHYQEADTVKSERDNKDWEEKWDEDLSNHHQDSHLASKFSRTQYQDFSSGKNIDSQITKPTCRETPSEVIYKWNNSEVNSCVRDIRVDSQDNTSDKMKPTRPTWPSLSVQNRSERINELWKVLNDYSTSEVLEALSVKMAKMSPEDTDKLTKLLQSNTQGYHDILKYYMGDKVWHCCPFAQSSVLRHSNSSNQSDENSEKTRKLMPIIPYQLKIKKPTNNYQN